MSAITPSNLERRIRAEYEAGGYSLGYRFLNSPASTLATAEVAFLGINPGGSHAHKQMFANDGETAYTHEQWGDIDVGEAPLQRQAVALFDRLGVDAVDVLSGNVIPFRSRSHGSLENPIRALAFSVHLWADIFSEHCPSMIITFGSDPFDAVAGILGAGRAERIPVGWGDVTGRRSEFDGGRLVGLPHLSRFTIIGREASRAALARLLATG